MNDHFPGGMQKVPRLIYTSSYKLRKFYFFRMSDDDLPPLLDESELVQKIIDRKEKREIPKTNRELLDFETDEAYVPNLIKSELEPKVETKKPEKKSTKKPVKKSSFGGFQDQV